MSERTKEIEAGMKDSGVREKNGEREIKHRQDKHASSSSSSGKNQPSSQEHEKKRARDDSKKYEMDRRKVQKYKEDKLKARKDHTRSILEQQAQEKRRVLLGKQSEFLGSLEFRNTLPELPFDPKFVTYPHEPEHLVKYKPSQVERDYIYELYVEPNLGLSIDLIDPEKYEVPKDKYSTALEPEDAAILDMKESLNIASKEKVRPSVPWLRRTEYMGTDLAEAVHRVSLI